MGLRESRGSPSISPYLSPVVLPLRRRLGRARGLGEALDFQDESDDAGYQDCGLARCRSKRGIAYRDRDRIPEATASRHPAPSPTEIREKEGGQREIPSANMRHAESV